MTEIADYFKARIKQRPPDGFPVAHGSTPVISFGDASKAKVATLGWNPSKREFFDDKGIELVGEERRLETLASIEETNLAHASDEAVRGGTAKSGMVMSGSFLERQP